MAHPIILTLNILSQIKLRLGQAEDLVCSRMKYSRLYVILLHLVLRKNRECRFPPLKHAPFLANNGKKMPFFAAPCHFLQLLAAGTSSTATSSKIDNIEVWYLIKTCRGMSNYNQSCHLAWFMMHVCLCSWQWHEVFGMGAPAASSGNTTGFCSKRTCINKPTQPTPPVPAA